MRISEAARQAGVAASTVRFYERIGLLPGPPRAESGYRAYDTETVSRLVFVARAKRIGLSLEQIAQLLPVWDGVNCAAARQQITELVDQERVAVHERIEELRSFAAQLDEVRVALSESPAPTQCRPDMSCCVPNAPANPRRVSVELTPRRARGADPTAP